MKKEQAIIGTKVQEVFSLNYAELTSMITSNQLEVGKKYIINDYQTVHTIPTTTVTNTGPIEPLIVTALSSNELEPIAYSTLHPEDIIYYNINNDVVKVPGCTKGFISRRIDTLRNNNIPSDWRYIKYRRYALNVTNVYDAGITYSKADAVIDGTTNSIYFSMVSGNIGNLLTDKTKWLKSTVIFNGEYISPFPTSYSAAGLVAIPVNSTDFNDYNIFPSNATVINNTFVGPNPNYLLTFNTVFRNYINSAPVFVVYNVNATISYSTIARQFSGNTQIGFSEVTALDIIGNSAGGGGSVLDLIVPIMKRSVSNAPSPQNCIFEDVIEDCIFNDILSRSIVNFQHPSTPFKNNIINYEIQGLSLKGGMRNNVVNTLVLSPLDITSATHIYNNYHTEWVSNSAYTNVYVKYLDPLNVEQIVLVTT